jgi:hypothetical protein
MNLFGVDVSGLDLEAFDTYIRVLSLLVGVATGLALIRWKRTWMGLAGITLLALLVWLGSNYPLLRLYGLQMPGDRLRNLAAFTGTAAGHSVFSNGTIGRTSLEPLWSALVGILCWGHPERVYTVYPFLSAAVLLGLGLILYLHFSRGEAGEEDGRIRGFLVAYFVILLATTPLDYIGPYRAYWTKVFFLKPNHALGFLFVPVLIGLLDKPFRPWRAVAVGVTLGVLGWVFIIHWAFFCFSLGVYLLLKIVLARRDFTSEASKIILVVAMSAVIVAPYYKSIATHFPHAVTVERGTSKEEPTRSQWGDVMPTSESLLLLVTLDQGLIFYLGLVGIGDWLRRRGRKEMFWAGLVLGAYLLWLSNILMYYTARAREADEFYCFLIFALSIAAANGAYQLCAISRRWIGSFERAWRCPVYYPAAVMFLALIPLTSSYWWNPSKMDGHFRNAMEPLPLVARQLTDWVLRETSTNDVLIGVGEYVELIPACTGRQILVPRREWEEVARRIILGGDDSAREIDGKTINYLVVEPRLVELLGIERDFFDRNPRFQKVFQERHWKIYRIIPMLT